MRVFVVMLVVLVMGRGAWGDVASLILDLRAEEWGTRQRAEEALVRMGPAVAGEIEAAIAGCEDLEARTRLAAILGRIERDRAVGVSRITLEMPNATAQEVVAEISRQAGAPVRLEGQDGAWNSRRDFAFIDEPFWSVMRQVCEAYDVFPRESGGGEQGFYLGPNAGHPFKAPVCERGPFVMMLQRVNHSYSIDLSSPGNRQSNTSIQMTVMAEPKMVILGRSYSPVLKEAVNESGESLLPAGDGGNGYDSSRTHVWSASFGLNDLAARSVKLAKLRGVVSVLAQVRSQTIEVEDLSRAAGRSQEAGPMRIVIQDLSQVNGRYSLKIAIFNGGRLFNEGGRLFNDRGGMLNQGMRVSGSRRGEYVAESVRDMKVEGDRIEYTVNLRALNGGEESMGRPMRLVWKVPTEIEELEIPFEFTDVPLQ